MTTLIYVNGRKGRMGQALCREILQGGDFTLCENLAECDVVIDFSSPTALPNLLKSGKPLVIGTTGFSEEEKKIIHEASKRVPLFVASNFSIGILHLRHMVHELSEKIGNEVSIEIIEAHRKNKKDAPSGTALTLKEETGRDIPIHSIRAGDILGDHTVIFAFEGERLELKHQVHSRTPFVLGALKAALFLKSQPSGYYSMKDLHYASC